MAIPAGRIKQSNIPTLALADGVLRLTCSFIEKDVAKSVSGCRWNPEYKSWDYPVSVHTYQGLKDVFPRLYIAPEVDAVISELAAAQQSAAAMKVEGWENAVPDEPMPLKTKPFNHQILAFNIGMKLPNVALLMEQGCGKSLTAVAIAGRRYLRGDIQQVLAVAPASVVPVWPREFQIHGSFPVEVLTLEGPVAKRIEALEAFEPGEALAVAATNYEAVWRMEEELAKWIKAKPTMIIVDEAQRIKSVSAQQSKTMHHLGKLAKYRQALTGTPVCNNPLDLFSQYKFLDPTIFGPYIGAFRARYAVEVSLKTGSGNKFSKVVGYQNLEELKERAHSIAFRCTKAECLDLPEQINQTLYCNFEAKAASIYNQLLRESVAELQGDKCLTAPNVLSKLLRLSQLAGGYLNVDKEVTLVSKAKMKLLEETLEDLMEAGKKVVIFARFLPEIAAIKQLLMDREIPLQCITGEVDLKVRGVAVEQFQTKPEIRVFLAQIQCAGLGITLTAADTAIFYSLDFSFANYDQCRARIHRIGQKNNCTYIHLVTKGTVDEKILQALQNKRDIATDVIDKWRELVGNQKV